jgi:hypothetical protein
MRPGVDAVLADVHDVIDRASTMVTLKELLEPRVSVIYHEPGELREGRANEDSNQRSSSGRRSEG